MRGAALVVAMAMSGLATIDAAAAPPLDILPKPAPASGAPAEPATGPPLNTTPQPEETQQVTADASFETFEDGEARITLAMPDGGADCRADGPVQLGRDLRSVVFLDPSQAQDCFGPAGSTQGRRRIATFAGLDDAFDREPQCAAPQAVCDTLAGSLRKRKHRTVASTDGWIDVIVVTKGDPALVPAPLRYTIVLHTDQAHLTVDLKAFKSMLGSMASP